jgi:hypothetical protein
MSRISSQKGTHWLASSFRARAFCHQNTIARNRINMRISDLNTGAEHLRPRCLFFSTSSAGLGRAEKKKPKIDAATLDSMSSTLIEDLYGGPSSAKSKVTLDDVLALKPAKRIVSVDEFNKTKDLIATSFNVSQLRVVLRSQNQPCGWRTKKSIVINQIMLLMDLEVKAPDPEPAVVEEPYTPVEPTVQKSFPSSRRELFFMLESEGDTLRRLEKDMNVRVAINIAHENYIIQGTEQAIKEAQELIRELVVVTEETWDISPYKNRDLIMTAPSALEDIARRSGTFISAGTNDTLIIAGRSSGAMDEAKRLFDLRLHEVSDQGLARTIFEFSVGTSD